MSPAKIAIAVAVTIAAIAGIGAMKKVTGTSSAVAIVAVRPGTAPTNRPNSDAANITAQVVGIEHHRRKARAGRRPRLIARSQREALEYAPRQRHAQQLVERVADDERHDDGDDDARCAAARRTR